MKPEVHWAAATAEVTVSSRAVTCQRSEPAVRAMRSRRSRRTSLNINNFLKCLNFLNWLLFLLRSPTFLLHHQPPPLPPALFHHYRYENKSAEILLLKLYIFAKFTLSVSKVPYLIFVTDAMDMSV